MEVRVFATGGTFDKVFDEVRETMVFNETHLHEMLDLAKNKSDAKIETLMLIDSLHMRDEDRKKILEKCRSCKEDRIIITHGTSTIIETAKFLTNGIKDKAIILTGATVPYSFGKSDALFNLGYAFGVIQLVEKGVYIAINGRLFEWHNIKKNKDAAKFESIE